MTALVVGGSGQLGSACCEELLRRNQRVRVTVRDLARAGRLGTQGAEVVVLDVTDAGQRQNALEGVDKVILTANSVVPRAGDDPAAIDSGLLALVDEALSAAVSGIVLPSVPICSREQRVPPVRAKRLLEHRLLAEQASHWILRLPPFMEVWFALVGASLPLRGEPHATIGRPSAFLRRFRSVTGSLVEDRGLMLVPGSSANRHSFISVKDAARACVEAALCDGPAPAAPLDVGGPEVLSWGHVADVFGGVLNRRVRVLTTPPSVYATAARLLAPVAAVPSRTMAMNLYMACTESLYIDPGGGLVDPATMVTVERFLTSKAALSAGLSRVP